MADPKKSSLSGNERAVISQRNNAGLLPETQGQLNTIIEGAHETTLKGFQTPAFVNARLDGAKVVQPIEGDGALVICSDNRYGTTNAPESAGGDFSTKIILGVGFLNDGKTGQNSEISSSSPNIRIGAGITIYQRTATDKEFVFDDDEKTPKTKERRPTTTTPQINVSAVDILGDTISIAARNGGVRIIGGIDPTIPRYGMANKPETANTSFMGVHLIYGNPDKKILDDPKKPQGLQPIPKGDNLLRAMTGITGRIAELTSVVTKMQQDIITLQGSLAAHIHIVPLIVPSTGGVVTPTPTAPSIDLVGAVAIKSVSDVLGVLNLITNFVNIGSQKLNMSPISTAGINSLWNKTN